ncbi:MAG: type II 3-dehydroquinate dehydratase, partial [Gammaproteobacteria bacterium]|nr:type II 3-dehydroquinate dehydratase [Gammaproteobacteria bacterium]
HTSVALRDALLAVDLPFIEIHLSNIHTREPFRRRSFFSDIAVGTIAGLGATGYELALRAAIEFISE